jgi:hypothetical protein
MHLPCKNVKLLVGAVAIADHVPVVQETEAGLTPCSQLLLCSWLAQTEKVLSQLSA